MKKYIKIKMDFIPHVYFVGIGIGTERTRIGRDVLFFLPFIIIELSINKIKS